MASLTAGGPQVGVLKLFKWRSSPERSKTKDVSAEMTLCGMRGCLEPRGGDGKGELGALVPSPTMGLFVLKETEGKRPLQPP